MRKRGTCFFLQREREEIGIMENAKEGALISRSVFLHEGADGFRIDVWAPRFWIESKEERRS